MANMLIDGDYECDFQGGCYGDRFQKDVALIMFLAMRENPKLRLGYEVKAADKFDDIVLIDDKNEVIHFIQVQYGSYRDGKVKPVDEDALFPIQQRGGGFEIIKYLKSYLTVKNSFKDTMYHKKFYVISNRGLKKTHNGWITNENQEDVNEALRIAGFRNPPLKLTANQTTTKKLINQVNQEFYEVKDALRNLFFSGQVSETLKRYSTPLKGVLRIDKNKQCSFSDRFSPKSEQLSVQDLYDKLQEEQFDMSEKVKVDINFLQKDSKFKHLPTYVREEAVEGFIRDFSLLMGGPNDLRPLIDTELRKWLTTCVRPDTLGKLTQSDMDRLYSGLEYSFDVYSKLKKDRRPFFNIKVIQECLNELRHAFTKLDAEDTKDLNEFYINRRIMYKGNIKQSATTNVTEDGAKFDDVSMLPRVEIEHKIQTPKENCTIDDEQLVEDLQSRFKDQQCIVLVADPGMGKTCWLKFLAFEVQKKYDFRVFLVYFSNLVKELDKIVQIFDFDSVVSVLRAVLSKENCDIIRNAPDQPDLGGYSILLAVDGFDEIHAKYTRKVIDMLKLLQKKRSIQLIISSRVHLRDLLEKELGVQAMFLEPFCKEDQINYLRKKWNVSCDVDKDFRVYSHVVLMKLQSSNISNLHDIFGLPLMMKMLAETHQDRFKQYMDMVTTNQEPLLDFSVDASNIVYLYDNFIRKCFYLKLVEKSGGYFDDDDLDAMIDGFILEHQILAMKLLDIEVAEHLFKNPIIIKKYENFRRRCEKESELSRLVRVVGDDVQFCHSSYSDYFLAKYLCDHIYTLEPARVLDILSKHDVIRKFSMIMMDGKDDHFCLLNHLCETDLNVALWACENGCFNIIKFLLENCKSLTIDIISRMLQISAANGYTNVCDLLLKHGADPNEGDQEKQSVLHLSASDSHATVVDSLLRHHSNIKALEQDIWTPLHFAAEMGHIRIVELLLMAGANPDSRSSTGKTPLHYATHYGHSEAAELSIELCCDDVNAVDEEGSTALQLAAGSGRMSVINKLLWRGANVNATDNQGLTALHLAAGEGDVRMIQLLVEAGANLESRTKYGETPLHIAARKGNKDAAKLFIRHNSDVNALDKDGNTALHMAAEVGNYEIIQSLIAARANTNSRAIDGRTPLHIAAMNGHREISELFMNHGCDVNAMDNEKCTALHLAAMKGHVAVVELLVRHHADVNVLDRNKSNALSIAVRQGHDKVVKLLIGTEATFGLVKDNDDD